VRGLAVFFIGSDRKVRFAPAQALGRQTGFIGHSYGLADINTTGKKAPTLDL
jgi:hypothetical protein